jgi:hypothetical protein
MLRSVPSKRFDQVRNMILEQNIQLLFNARLPYGQVYRQPPCAVLTRTTRICGPGTNDRTGAGVLAIHIPPTLTESHLMPFNPRINFSLNT